MSLLEWIKNASRNNRVFRTAIQSFSGYVIVHLPTFWDGRGDVWLALKALLVGALAAAISAVWKTAEADLVALQQEDAIDKSSIQTKESSTD